MQVAPFQRSRTCCAGRGPARRHVVHHYKLHFVNRHLANTFILRCVCELHCYRSRWVTASFPPDRSPACIAELGVLFSETSRYLICIGDERTAKSEHVQRAAMRSSAVPCQKERGARPLRTATPATCTTAPKASAKACPGFLCSSGEPPSIIEVDAPHHHGRYEYALLEPSACSEMSDLEAFDPVAVLPLPKSGAADQADARGCPVRSISPSTSGARKPSSHRTSIQALGIATTLTFHVEMMHGE
jgi:hypothetical protein